MTDTPALANDKYRANLRTTYIDGVDTSLNVNAIPTNLPTIIVAGWNTIYQTVFRIEGTSGTNSSNYALTGVTKLRGYSGNLPENLALNCLNVEEYFNQWGDQIAAVQEIAEAAQAATENYAADSGGDDDYEITITGVTEYIVGKSFKFKANTANTGVASLNINSIGQVTIKKMHDQDLVTGDIEAGQIVEVVYDGTYFQMQSQVATTPSTGMQYSDTRVKVGTFTRNIASSSGDVSYTGVGFTPTSLLILSIKDQTSSMAVGFASGSSAQGMVGRQISNSSDTYYTNMIAAIQDTSGNVQKANLKTFDADGFTLTWTASGSQTGTGTFIYIAYR